jgi:hypothetical protein
MGFRLRFSPTNQSNEYPHDDRGRLREKIQKGLRVSQGRCGRSREGGSVAACRSEVGCGLEAQRDGWWLWDVMGKVT